MKIGGYVFFLGCSLLAILSHGLAFAEEEEQEKRITVYSLQEEGWEIFESKTQEEILPGLAPYQILPRVISLTTYWLRHNKEEIVCQILYDSQLDTQREDCGEPYAIPLTPDAYALQIPR